MRGKPAGCRAVLAILLVGAILGHDELGLQRALLEQLGHSSFCEQKYSVPSSAMRTCPPSRLNAVSPPLVSIAASVCANMGKSLSGVTGSSMVRIWLSVGTFSIPSSVWQFDLPRPRSSAV